MGELYKKQSLDISCVTWWKHFKIKRLDRYWTHTHIRTDNFTFWSCYCQGPLCASCVNWMNIMGVSLDIWVSYIRNSH